LFIGTLSKDFVKASTKGYSRHCAGKKNKVLSQAGNRQKATKHESQISSERGSRVFVEILKISIYFLSGCY